MFSVGYYVVISLLSQMMSFFSAFTFIFPQFNYEVRIKMIYDNIIFFSVIFLTIKGIVLR